MVDTKGSHVRAARAWRALLLAALALPALAGAAPPPARQATQIGAIIPASWPSKADGDDIRNGMMLALKTWPGQPAPTLVVQDSACDQRKAAAAAKSMLDAKVDVLISGFCVLGSVPRMAHDAGVPFVSANAERLSSASEASIQMGAVPVNLAEGIAAKLRAETGLRVTAESACWIDFVQTVPQKYDAALCPALHIDRARWAEIAPSYTAAYRKPFSASAARGYAAMQIALAAIKQLRAGSKPLNAMKDVKEVGTVLGKVSYRDEAGTPGDAMHLILAPTLPRLSARESSALDEVLKSKGCGCSKTGECPPSKTWGAMPFVVACPAAR
ncbi:MAG TPA: hypothetical protein VJ743_21290 [Albitalea sp.]|nr:hypothetical protein [Albitalea sp.]